MAKYSVEEMSTEHFNAGKIVRFKFGMTQLVILSALVHTHRGATNITLPATGIDNTCILTMK